MAAQAVWVQKIAPLQGLRVSIDAAGARGRGAHEGALEIAPTGFTRIHRRGGGCDAAAGARGRGAHEGALEIAPTGIARIYRRGGGCEGARSA
jgi:hypothetical protein